MNKPFNPPTLQEVQQLVSDRRYNIDPESFWYFYASKDWMVGKTKMKDWRMALAGWNCRNKKERNRKTKLYPIRGKACGIPSCPLPAVYKGNTGGYDYWRCMEHLPEKVKEHYC